MEGYAGAALWLRGCPPGRRRDEHPPATHRAEQVHKDLPAVFAQVRPYLPREPYWYLPLIGVDPFHQGKGYGAALMQRPCSHVMQQAVCLSRIDQPEEYPAL